MELNINYVKKSLNRTFEEYENFYTLLHIRKVTPEYKVKHIYKIIYGHFIEDDYLDIFEYKTVYNGKIQFDSMTHTCKLNNLQKPNSKEKYYKIFTYPEIFEIKKYYVENAKLEDYVIFKDMDDYMENAYINMGGYNQLPEKYVILNPKVKNSKNKIISNP